MRNQKGFILISSLIAAAILGTALFMINPLKSGESENLGGGNSTVNTLSTPIASKDEGVSLTTRTTSFNFVGSGVTATNSGNAVTVTIGGGGDALTTNPLSQFAATTSAQLDGVISDDTGSGALVFANSPVFTTPNIGSATGSISGNAGTATALAANGANCSAGNYPLGVDASGAVEDCTAVAAGGSITLDLGDDGGNDSTALGEIAITGDTNGIFSESANDKLLINLGNDVPKADLADAATALAANPTDCAANQFATTIAASGNLTCAAIIDAMVPNDITIDLATLASTVTVVDGTDATSFVAIFDSATGSLAVKTDGGLLYDASNATLTATTFVGALTGNASTATALAGNPADCSANQFATTIAASGALTCAAIVDADVPNGITIDLATLASTVTVVDSTDATSFVAIFDSATGSLPVKTDGGLLYNASNATLTATTFSGALSGNASTATALAADPSDCSSNQFAHTIAASGALTCSALTLAGAQFANQGTTTTVLHGNGSGNPSWSGIVSADITNGTITVADTNITAGRSLTWSTDDMAADAELYTDTKCVWLQNPTASDDLKSIWRSKIASTITSLWAESDQTVTFMLQIDDGTPQDLDSSDLAPAAGTAEDTSLSGGDTTMAAGDRLDIDIASVSGTPTWVSICWTFTYDD